MAMKNVVPKGDFVLSLQTIPCFLVIVVSVWYGVRRIPNQYIW